ncbi:MAG: hypothetical protein IT510_07040 [Sulfuritalea sp.]|nr:hypothetical protein [Sulfuritalea sp.]
MKQKLITRLILGAFAGAAVVGAVQAGQITASSTNVAREVITTNLQLINSPSISYRFSGDINATVQAQEFQVQFILQNGARWNAAALPSDNAFSITPTAGTDAGLEGVGGTNFTVVSKAVDASNPAILWATFRVPVAAVGPWTDSLLDQPIITLNRAGAGTPATILNLYDVVGDIVSDYNTSGICVANKTLSVEFRHFKLLANPAALADGTTNGTADEHTRAGSTNTAGIINFPTNIRVAIAPSTLGAKVNVAGANLNFSSTGAPGTSWVNANIANLGTVTLVQNATGYDSGLVNNYLLTGAPAASGLTADDATAALNNGNVEVEKVDVVVSATNGFVSGGTLWLDRGANCATGIASGGGVATAITALNAAGPITLTIATAQVNAAFGTTGTGPVHVCYGKGTVNPIPLSAFSAVATVDKQNAGVDAEQNNICSGNLYSLGGGVKIDVRNYANSQQTANTGWMSVIRLINNSETRHIDVYGQIIHADGTYGPWGLLTVNEQAGTGNAGRLAPRAVLNLTSAQLDALLTSAPATIVGTNGPNAPQDQARGGSRLRITSNAGSTLRVQNYLYNPASQNFIEASSTQAVDFEGNTDRAPATEGQYQSQDAFLGINGR